VHFSAYTDDGDGRAAEQTGVGQADRSVAMTGRRDEEAGGGPAAGAGPRRDRGGTPAGDDEITGGGATAEGQVRAEEADHDPTARPGGRPANLPGDDQGDPA
jgi:hypothetical protein